MKKRKPRTPEQLLADEKRRAAMKARHGAGKHFIKEPTVPPPVENPDVDKYVLDPVV